MEKSESNVLLAQAATAGFLARAQYWMWTSWQLKSVLVHPQLVPFKFIDIINEKYSKKTRIIYLFLVRSVSLLSIIQTPLQVDTERYRKSVPKQLCTPVININIYSGLSAQIDGCLNVQYFTIPLVVTLQMASDPCTCGYITSRSTPLYLQLYFFKHL